MFGKKSKMSSNDKFVMAQGRAAGNIPNGKGHKPHGISKGPAGPTGKVGPDPFKPRTLRVGKNSGFSSE